MQPILPAGMQTLIATYGYWLMMFGALIEGETFLVAGGIAASAGMLHLPLLMLLALVGSTIHDNFFFSLGRFFGHKILEKKPLWAEKSDRVLRLFEKYGDFLIIALRFAYGFRTIIPTALGISEIPWLRFFLVDVIGGALWSVVFVGGGYFFGQGLIKLVHLLHGYEKIAFRIVVVLVVLVVLGLIIAWWTKRQKKAEI